MRARRMLAAGAAGVLMSLSFVGQAFAYKAASGYAVTDFATGFSPHTQADAGASGAGADGDAHARSDWAGPAARCFAGCLRRIPPAASAKLTVQSGPSGPQSNRSTDTGPPG